MNNMSIADLTIQLTQNGKKQDAVITEAVTGATATGISVGFSQVDNLRQVEILDGIFRLLQYAIDIDALDDTVSNMAELPIGGDVSKCIITSPSVAPATGGVFIEIGESYDYTKGTISLSTDVTVALQVMQERLKGA